MKTRTFTTLSLLVVLALIAPGGAQPPAVQAQSVVFVPQQPQAGLHLSAVTASTAPVEAVNDSNIVYVCNTGNIGRTGDISMTSPIWSNITPPNVGTINDCVPDPWSPTTTMWVVGSTGMWKGENLNMATPLWTVLQTTDQIRSATDGFTQNGSEPDRIVPSASISGTVFVLYSHGGLGSAPNTWVGRSTDNGATWAWTRVANEGEQARDFGFAITQNAVSPDNVTVWASTRRDHLYKSTDGGKSFQRVLSLPSTTFYQLHAMYSPPLDNDGSILYVGGGSSSGATSFISKTVDGGMTWAIISPVGADSAPRGPLRQYEIAGAAGSASHLYALVQRAQDVVNERKKLYYSSDGGASWSLRQDFASRTDEVLGIGVNATDENRLYVLKDSMSSAATDLIFLSDDGGLTWQDKSGDWRASVGLWRNAVAVWDASIRSGLTPDPVSPNNWTMVLSLRPTFRWQSVPGAASYRLSLFHYSAVEGQGGPPIDILVLSAGATTDPSRPGFHRHKLGFDLQSGTTPVEAGYVWKIEALDGTGQVLSSSLLSAFQIPSLGGTWESVQAKGLCTGYFVDGRRKTAPCNFPFDPNPYWNQYDNAIYRWSERWDLPPALIKAIIIGETGSAIGPRRICWWDRCEVFPPHRGYTYEPYWDYDYYVASNGLLVGGIAMFGQPDHPPTEPFDGLGPYSFPYDREVLSGTTIYRYATGIGYPYSVPNVTRIPGCGEADDDPCPAKAHPAQYRTAASYGLGQVVYMFWHTDLDNFAAFVRPVDPPQKVPPEELYQPELGINFMGFALHTKRCASATTSQLGAQDTNYEPWGPVLLAYNGGAKRDYDDTVIERAVRFTEPMSVIQGWQPTVQLESPGHDCENPFGQTAGSIPVTLLSRLSPGTEIELDSGAIDLRGDGSQVWLTLSALPESAYRPYKGIIRIFSDETRATLLWSSSWIENVNPVAAFRMSSLGSQPLLLVDWASGPHAARTYLVQWEGEGFRLVPTLDLEGQATDGVGSDGGGVFVSQGSLVSLEQTYEAANQRRVIEWSYGPSGFQQARTYLIEWGITPIYLPLVVKN